jgi:hypothetical protein
MAPQTVQIQELARIGAAARLKELAGEIEAIRKAFPDIEKRGEVPASRAREPRKARKRSGWSDAARKAVSLRMKKYWAAKRKTAAA